MPSAAIQTPDPDAIDHVVTLHGVSWQVFEDLLRDRGDARPLVTYIDGELELMTPSRFHEGDKKRLARLIEAWSDGAGIDLDGIGSWLLKDAAMEIGLEPDECYVRGRLTDDRERPDFAVEVIWSHVSPRKHDVYAGLGIHEVWTWRAPVLTIRVLRDGSWIAVDRSPTLPELDPALIVEGMLSDDSQRDAARRIRHLAAC